MKPFKLQTLSLSKLSPIYKKKFLGFYTFNSLLSFKNSNGSFHRNSLPLLPKQLHVSKSLFAISYVTWALFKSACQTELTLFALSLAIYLFVCLLIFLSLISSRINCCMQHVCLVAYVGRAHQRLHFIQGIYMPAPLSTSVLFHL